jgi:hypothetical protein
MKLNFVPTTNGFGITIRLASVDPYQGSGG